MVLTIFTKEAPSYFLFWIIYAYALYRTIKIVVAIRKRVITKNQDTNYSKVCSYISLISALFTVQMMEFALIQTFGTNDKMIVLQLLTQGFIFMFSIALSIILFMNYFEKKINYS